MYIWSLRGDFVQMNIDGSVYLEIGITLLYCQNGFRHLSAIFLTFRGFQKSQILGLAIAELS